MKIRGIGIIDVRALFGIRSVRQQKRIEVVVQLEHWSDEATYDRTGLAQDTTRILGVEVPRVVIPLNPGKNITVISGTRASSVVNDKAAALRRHCSATALYQVARKSFSHSTMREIISRS